VGFDSICQKARNEGHDSKAWREAAGEDDESVLSPGGMIQQPWGQPHEE